MDFLCFFLGIASLLPKISKWEFTLPNCVANQPSFPRVVQTPGITLHYFSIPVIPVAVRLLADSSLTAPTWRLLQGPYLIMCNTQFITPLQTYCYSSGLLPSVNGKAIFPAQQSSRWRPSFHSSFSSAFIEKNHFCLENSHGHHFSTMPEVPGRLSPYIPLEL